MDVDEINLPMTRVIQIRRATDIEARLVDRPAQDSTDHIYDELDEVPQSQEEVVYEEFDESQLPTCANTPHQRIPENCNPLLHNVSDDYLPMEQSRKQEDAKAEEEDGYQHYLVPMKM